MFDAGSCRIISTTSRSTRGRGSYASTGERCFGSCGALLYGLCRRAAACVRVWMGRRPLVAVRSPFCVRRMSCLSFRPSVRVAACLLSLLLSSVVVVVDVVVFVVGCLLARLSSSVLRSSVATQVNLQIVRAFVSLRQMIAVKPEYELLRETVRRIEADVKIDGKIMSGKLSQLSQKVNALSGLFEQFQESYVVIKRPVEGVGDG